MSQQYFTSVTWATVASPLYVPIGFQPARVEAINLTAATTPVDAEGWKAVWQNNMSQGTAIVTGFATFATSPNVTLVDKTSVASSNGISLWNPVGSQSPLFGASISAFSHANPGVITVNSTYLSQVTAGCFIMVSAVADDQSGASLNGVYYVASVTATTITLGTAPAGVSLPSYPPYVVKSLSTSSSALYISGGYVTVLQTAQAVVPNPPYDAFSNVPSWWNNSQIGIILGTSCFANADNNDVILIAAYDVMSP